MISVGCHAIIQKVGGEHLRVCQLTKKQNILIEKLRFQIDGAFGQPFGLFEASAGKLTHACPETLVSNSKVGDIELQDTDTFISEPSGQTSEEASCSLMENEEVNPAQARQKVTREEISEMKDSGMTTGELVAKLVGGSASFATRTVYSQSKYIRRKTKKHSDRVLILKPTIRLIAESYYKKDAERISNLRIDLLSYVLTASGIHSGSKCLVFEQCLGLLTAAVLERLGGQGACIHVHRGEIAQSIPCIQSMDFPDEIYVTFLPLRISTLVKGSVVETLEERANDEEVIDKVNQELVRARRLERLNREKKAFEIYSNHEVESLLIAVQNVDPIDVLERTWDSLQLSSRIVVYSTVEQPILEVYRWLKERGAVNVQISDAFYRSYQVLPDRTRPTMSQLVAGGYVIHGIKVALATQ